MQKAMYSWMSLCLIFGTGILCDENTVKQRPIPIKSDYQLKNTQNKRSIRKFCSIPFNNGSLYSKNPNPNVVLSQGTIVEDATIVYVNCDPKYYKNTSYEVIMACQDGKWKPLNLKICLKMCPPQNSDSLDTTCIYNGCNVDCTKPSIPGTKLKANCKDTHYLKNGIPEKPIEQQCHENGTWIGSEGYTCQKKIMCPPQNSDSLDTTCIYNGCNVDCTKPSISGTKLKAKCKDTHYLKNGIPEKPIELQCHKNGTWIGSEGYTCQKKPSKPVHDIKMEVEEHNRRPKQQFGIWIPVPVNIYYPFPCYPYHLYPSPLYLPPGHSQSSRSTQRPLYPPQFTPSPTKRPCKKGPSQPDPSGVATPHPKETIATSPKPDPETPTPEVTESDIPEITKPPTDKPYQTNTEPKATTTRDYPVPDAPVFTGAPSIHELKAQCKESRGQFPSKSSCNKFIDCWDETVVEKLCNDRLMFHPEKRVCDFPFNVDCGSRPITEKVVVGPIWWSSTTIKKQLKEKRAI